MWTMHCPACRRTECHTEPDLIDVMRAGWPKCCGAEMVLTLGPDHLGGTG